MIETDEKPAIAQRVFKTMHFAKTAKKADIKDKELCEAIQVVIKGQADDLGGGVFKKRLNKNLHRSIILAKVEIAGSTLTCLQRKTAITSTKTNSESLEN